MRSRRDGIAVLLLVLLACGSPAQEKGRAVKLIPLPYAFYSPETSLAGGAILLMVADASPDKAGQLDGVSRFGGFAALKGQAEAFASTELYLPDSLMRITLDSHVAKFPSKFFGVGPAAGSEEDYVPLEGAIDLTAGFRILPGLYAGPRLRFFGSQMLERAPGGLLAGGSVIGGNGAGIIGTGVRLTYEGRDTPISAARGIFVDASGTLNVRASGDSADYGAFTLDARGYTVPFEALKAVLAGQFYAAFIGGNAPFQELPRIGGDELLRGYYDGRYRDKFLLALQGELRIPVWWRFGVALFGAAGQVAPDPLSFSLDGVKLAGGVGLRFVIDTDSGANLRLDVAWTGTDFDFYFNLGEAF